MKRSVPFLGSIIEQMPTINKYGHDCVEATIFNYKDLLDATWNKVWSNVALAAKIYGPNNVTFHFPVNDSNYSSDVFVRNRLHEALNRATDLGLHGVVVHSNRIRLINEWANVDLNSDRLYVIDTLNEIRESINGNTWLCLENMPVADNYAIEIDPLFSYPRDFECVIDTNVGIVWDICHYTNTLATIEQVLSGIQNRKYYPNLQEADYLDFLQLSKKIKHWHFSSFKGISNPDTKSICKEGCLPDSGDLPEPIYKRCLQEILKVSAKDMHMVFEIVDADYIERKNMPLMIEWFNANAILSVVVNNA